MTALQNSAARPIPWSRQFTMKFDYAGGENFWKEQTYKGEKSENSHNPVGVRPFQMRNVTKKTLRLNSNFRRELHLHIEGVILPRTKTKQTDAGRQLTLSKVNVRSICLLAIF